MADLTLTVGPITSSINATNAKASRVIVGVLRRIGLDPDAMSNQEQADAFMAHIKAFVVGESKSAEKNIKHAEGTAEVDADPPEWEE